MLYVPCIVVSKCKNRNSYVVIISCTAVNRRTMYQKAISTFISNTLFYIYNIKHSQIVSILQALSIPSNWDNKFEKFYTTNKTIIVNKKNSVLELSKIEDNQLQFRNIETCHPKAEEQKTVILDSVILEKFFKKTPVRRIENAYLYGDIMIKKNSTSSASALRELFIPTERKELPPHPVTPVIIRITDHHLILSHTTIITGTETGTDKKPQQNLYTLNLLTVMNNIARDEDHNIIFHFNGLYEKAVNKLVKEQVMIKRILNENQGKKSWNTQCLLGQSSNKHSIAFQIWPIKEIIKKENQKKTIIPDSIIDVQSRFPKNEIKIYDIETLTMHKSPARYIYQNTKITRNSLPSSEKQDTTKRILSYINFFLLFPMPKSVKILIFMCRKNTRKNSKYYIRNGILAETVPYSFNTFYSGTKNSTNDRSLYILSDADRLVRDIREINSCENEKELPLSPQKQIKDDQCYISTSYFKNEVNFRLVDLNDHCTINKYLNGLLTKLEKQPLPNNSILNYYYSHVCKQTFPENASRHSSCVAKKESTTSISRRSLTHTPRFFKYKPKFITFYLLIHENNFIDIYMTVKPIRRNSKFTTTEDETCSLLSTVNYSKTDLYCSTKNSILLKDHDNTNKIIRIRVRNIDLFKVICDINKNEKFNAKMSPSDDIYISSYYSENGPAFSLINLNSEDGSKKIVDEISQKLKKARLPKNIKFTKCESQTYIAQIIDNEIFYYSASSSNNINYFFENTTKANKRRKANEPNSCNDEDKNEKPHGLELLKKAARQALQHN